jgi:hypothetical protein
MAGRRRKQATISRAKLRARHLAAQNLELVAQDQQLDVLDVHAAATPNERAQQRPEREVAKRQGHYADPPTPVRERRDTTIGALQASWTRLLGCAGCGGVGARDRDLAVLNPVMRR